VKNTAGLTVLNLSKNEIRDIQNLETLTSLTRLNISDNQLSALNNLGVLHNLTEIRAARNCIASVDLQGLRQLQVLDLANNKLKSLSDLKSVSRQNLTQLFLQDNPLCSADTYRQSTFSTFTNLVALDGQHFQAETNESDGQETAAAGLASDGTQCVSCIDAVGLRKQIKIEKMRCHILEQVLFSIRATSLALVIGQSLVHLCTSHSVTGARPQMRHMIDMPAF
jgi:hypothetical protein